MQRMQGPRDWMPPPDPPRPRTTYAWPEPPPAVGRPRRGLGLLSFLLGAGATVMALAPTAVPAGYSGYLFSTIGVTAVLVGIAAMKRRGRTSLLPVLGILLGAFATIFMVSLMVQFHQSQLASPVVEMPITPVEISSPMLPAETEASVPADERMQLAQVAGTISYLLSKNFETSGSYPTALQATSAGLVWTPAGSIQLPTGAALQYSPATTGSGYSLTVTGAGGAVANYDTATGVVTTN